MGPKVALLSRQVTQQQSGEVKLVGPQIALLRQAGRDQCTLHFLGLCRHPAFKCRQGLCVLPAWQRRQRHLGLTLAQQRSWVVKQGGPHVALLRQAGIGALHALAGVDGWHACHCRQGVHFLPGWWGRQGVLGLTFAQQGSRRVVSSGAKPHMQAKSARAQRISGMSAARSRHRLSKRACLLRQVGTCWDAMLAQRRCREIQLAAYQSSIASQACQALIGPPLSACQRKA